MSGLLARSDPHRVRRLEAMGIKVYALRSNDAANQRGDEVTGSSDPTRTSHPIGTTITIVCAELPEQRDRDSIVRALGIGMTAVNWLNLEKETLSALPKDAGAYLVLGQQLARIVGAELPTATQQRAPIVVVDAPSSWRGDAMAKRLCWQALRPLARALRS